MGTHIRNDSMFQILEKYKAGFQKLALNHHKLNGLYDIPNKQEVDDFLVKHPKLMDFAARAFKQIRRYFSSEVLSLEVTRDPEISNYEQLCVYIHTSLTVKEAVRTLNEFDDQWLLDHLNESCSKCIK